MKSVLAVNASGRYQDSLTRQVSAMLIDELKNQRADLEVNERDLAQGLPFVDQQWIGANFTDPDQRDPQQKQTLAFSDELVKELQHADTIVIGSPVYNFGVPAALKAWVDLVARARLTFRYTENGPEGLVNNKKVYLVMASGGVPIGSAMDFATPYIQHVLGFLGMTDVTVVDATKIDLKNGEVLAQL
ncbi:FMN-dependent NADH-azoreductase [Alteromonas sp. 14N.309.X.WAT.G.H12]|uniref:FMN-dependent NADH-azoreductase n=1 Tax=Alteromonas sp. 14N.309.X.WAT.G.H12 TaxID=3120824 RepID=UPI002FD28552